MVVVAAPITDVVVADYIRPAWAVGLTERPERYKVVYGGRNSGKSTAVGRELMIELAGHRLTLLCLREFQRSIRESVHQILSDAITEFRLDAEVRAAEIHFANGSRVWFRGMERNRESLKGYEGIDRVWIEEGQTLSRESWMLIDPTIRREGSQIYITFNPRYESDVVYQMAVVDPLPDAHIVKVNWYDNPGLPDVMNQLRKRSALREPEEYPHIWEGELRTASYGNPFGGARAIDDCIIEEQSLAPVVAFGVDEAFSENLTSDWTVVVGLDAERNVAHYERWQDDQPSRRQSRITAIVGNTPTLVDDTAGRGFLSNRLKELGCRAVSGLVFSQQAKEKIILGLATVITDGRLGIPRRVSQPGENGVLLDELRHYVQDERGRYGPDSQYGHDDTVDALALAVEQFHTPQLRRRVSIAAPELVT